jgi:hypothetical protein
MTVSDGTQPEILTRSVVVHAKNWCAPAFTLKTAAQDADGEGGTLTHFESFRC